MNRSVGNTYTHHLLQGTLLLQSKSNFGYIRDFKPDLISRQNFSRGRALWMKL